MTNTYLIDASIYIFQYYFSLPDNWFAKNGKPTAAVYGYTTFLLRFIEKEMLPSSSIRLAIAFDESLGTCFRNEIYTDYKSSRAFPDEDLAFQLNACREVSELIGVSCFSSDYYEADDLIGSLVKKLRRTSAPIGILTRDKDLGQLLLRPKDFLWDYAKDQRFFPDDIQIKFGVRPAQISDYLALVGDPIDDIPGVPGLGPKAAQVLLENFSGVSELLYVLERQGGSAIDQLPIRGAKSLAKKLSEYGEQLKVSHQLSQICSEVSINASSKNLAWKRSQVSMSKLLKFCDRMGFSRLKPRVEKVLS